MGRGGGKERGYGGARKVVCPRARAGSRRACVYHSRLRYNVLYFMTVVLSPVAGRMGDQLITIGHASVGVGL